MADILEFKPRPSPEESKIVVLETQQFYCPCGCITFKIFGTGHVHCAQCNGWHSRLRIEILPEEPP